MIRGVVLCGGESKRMGSDKGLLPIGADTWAQHAVQKLQALNIPVSLSLRKMQMLTYQELFTPELLIPDQVQAKGPLRGLLSTHACFPEDDLLLLACDMTEMNVDTLQYLQQIRNTFPGYDYYLYGQENFMEPLCAVYTSGALQRLYIDLKDGNLLNFSLHKLIRLGTYKALPITDDEKFNNHNIPSCKFLIG